MPRSIWGKLLLGFLTLGVITGILGLSGIIQLRHAGQITADTYDHPLMAINYARSAQTTFEQLENPVLDAHRLMLSEAGADDPAESMLDDLTVAEQRASSPAAVQLVRSVRALSQRWLEMRKHMSPRKHAVEPLPAHLAAISDELRDAFERMSEQMAADGFVQRRIAVGASRMAISFSVAATLAAIVLSVLLTFVMSRRIVRPISSAAAVANQIAAGNWETPIPPGGKDEAGALLASMAFMQGRILQRRQSSHDRLIAAMESSNEAMLLLDRDGQVVVCNSRVSSLLGLFDIRLEIGRTFTSAFPNSATSWAPRLQSPGEIELPDGKWVSISRQETSEGGSFLILSDVTLRKLYERKLETVAYVDPLTEIRNRAYLLDCFDRERASEDDLAHRAVIVVDIDRFRTINARHGARAGDQMLIGLGQCLGRMVGPDDICARIGGNEFALYLNKADHQSVEHLVDRIQTLRSQTIRVGEEEIALQISGGVAFADGQTTNGVALLSDARSALDRAKQRGGDQTQIFGDDLRREARTRLIIEHDLPEALRQKTIYLDYQPIMSLATGRVSGLEALARWRHPELGQIPPMHFVNVAEETGAIIELGQMVLEEAAAATAAWVAAHRLDSGFATAVNISPRQIADTRHARKILDFLDRDPAISSRLKLEITEGVLLDNPTAMASLLKEFRARGVQLSLDDFGTGYSSLSYLHKFAFDVLKIDRSFVIRLGESSEALRLVKTIIELGHDLGLKTVAEGIETEEQAQYLRDLGSDHGQGYLFSKPLAAADIPLFLMRDGLPTIGRVAA